jgi:hypothetical protein
MTNKQANDPTNNSSRAVKTSALHAPISTITNTKPPKLHYFEVGMCCDFNCTIEQIFISTKDEGLSIELTPEHLPELLAIVQRLQSYIV